MKTVTHEFVAGATTNSKNARHDCNKNLSRESTKKLILKLRGADQLQIVYRYFTQVITTDISNWTALNQKLKLASGKPGLDIYTEHDRGRRPQDYISTRGVDRSAALASLLQNKQSLT